METQQNTGKEMNASTYWKSLDADQREDYKAEAREEIAYRDSLIVSEEVTFSLTDIAKELAFEDSAERKAEVKAIVEEKRKAEKDEVVEMKRRYVEAYDRGFDRNENFDGSVNEYPLSDYDERSLNRISEQAEKWRKQLAA